MVSRIKKQKAGSNLLGAYCPSCGIMILMQPGIKQCTSCKALIGMDLWVESPTPTKEEETK